MEYLKTNQVGKKKRKNRGGLTPKTFHAECEEKEIYYCEVCKYEHDNNIKTSRTRLSGWTHLDPAHRYERDDYKNNQQVLWHFNQVIRACRRHHNYIDDHKEYREEVFLKLRGECILRTLIDNVDNKG